VARTRKKKTSFWSKVPGWSAISDETRRSVARIVFLSIAAVAVATGASYGVARLDAHVDRLVLDETEQATFTFVDLPRSLVSLAGADLEAALKPARQATWTGDALCRDIAGALASVGWVERVDSVRRLAGGRFEIRATFRAPNALVQLEDYFLFVDRVGVRLPGRYAYDPMWPILQGVSADPPSPGKIWAGQDLQAGLAVVAELSDEAFAGQVTGVLVGNFGGRTDPRATHIEVATDRAGGRVRWGSAPGFEIEENLVTHKVAILRQNYQRTGRLDAGYPVIDISTFPDRFTVPG